MLVSVWVSLHCICLCFCIYQNPEIPCLRDPMSCQDDQTSTTRPCQIKESKTFGPRCGVNWNGSNGLCWCTVLHEFMIWLTWLTDNIKEQYNAARLWVGRLWFSRPEQIMIKTKSIKYIAGGGPQRRQGNPSRFGWQETLSWNIWK